MSWETDVIHVLFIDDDDAFREVTTEVLDHLGYQVQAVGSMSDAMTALRSAEFDLVLSDLCISGDKDGLLILDFLDSMGIKEVPVIFITGSGYGEWLIAEARNRRRVGFLQKPVRMSELKRAIESIWSNQASEQRVVTRGQVDPSRLSGRRVTTNLMSDAADSN